MSDPNPTEPSPPEPLAPIPCRGCQQPFSPEKPSQRVCPACRAEHDALLRHVLEPLVPAGEDPLRRLWG